MDKLLKKLIAPVSPSGCEGAVAKVISELARPYGQISQDHLGNLVVHKNGNGKRIMVAAHMDTVGLVASYVDENGFVRFGKIGGVSPVALAGQRVIFENGVVGVVCYEQGTDLKELTLDQLFVDTAGQKVSVGDTAVYDGAPCFAGDRVISPYLDNRIGCAVCLKALELLQDGDNDIFCTFTVQEEVGTRGAGAAAFSICPDFAIAVDVCGVSDYPGKRTGGLSIDAGPVVKLEDRSAICHKAVCELLLGSAEQEHIPVQRYVAVGGGTDTGVISRSRGGVPAGCLSIPIRYTHSPNEIANLRVAEQCARLLAAALRD